jgi:hypothetical protein
MLSIVCFTAVCYINHSWAATFAVKIVYCYHLISQQLRLPMHFECVELMFQRINEADEI